MLVDAVMTKSAYAVPTAVVLSELAMFVAEVALQISKVVSQQCMVRSAAHSCTL
jgi:hypothetical protein